MPRRKRVPAKPVPEDTIVIEHDDVSDSASTDTTLSTDEEYAQATDKTGFEALAATCSLNDAPDDAKAIIALSKSADPAERKYALKKMCPCKVKREVDALWVRIVEMCKDPDDSVRYQVLHSLCDGSPKHLEDLVADTVKSFWNDPNDKIKRAARRAYNSWSRGNGINVL